MSKPLDDLVREARESLGSAEAKGVDWSAVDEKLFARIEQEQRDERARFARPWSSGSSGSRWLRPAPGLLAAAAAAAVVFAFAHHGEDVRGGNESVAIREAESFDGSEVGGRIVGVEGEARVLIDGKPAGQGTTLRVGDVIEVQRAGIVIERPGKLTLRIEGGSRAAVTKTDGALVLALAQGAVEAQVVPVASGEAFAVDVDGARVAVHGTHLRVARSLRAAGVGDRVTVDLNEGVIAIGSAPRLGSVVGSLVTAPAHAEFAATDISGSLTVRHDAESVRPPVTLLAARPTQTAALKSNGEHDTPVIAVAPPPAPVPAAPARPVAPAAAAADAVAHGEAHPASAGAGAAVAPLAVVESPAASEPASSQPESAADPETALQAAVKGCMDPRPHVENVTVVVSTTLHLDLADDGSVRSARFDPPVAPDVNACASSAIYRARFGHGGSATIRVDISSN